MIVSRDMKQSLHNLKFVCFTYDSAAYGKPPISNSFKIVPVLISLHHSPIFIFHLLPSPVQPTKFSFYISSQAYMVPSLTTRFLSCCQLTKTTTVYSFNWLHDWSSETGKMLHFHCFIFIITKKSKSLVCSKNIKNFVRLIDLMIATFSRVYIFSYFFISFSFWDISCQKTSRPGCSGLNRAGSSF